MRPSLVPILLALIILATTVGLRFYRFFDRTGFTSDSASDLLIAREIVENRARPPVGPWLSLPVKIPPTYYQILAFWFYLSPSPEGTTVGFALMDIAGIAFLAGAAALIFDVPTALILAVLAAVSMELIVQSQSMWQPYPLFFFLSASLFFFSLSLRIKLAWPTVIGALLYAAAFAVYPAPIILLPFTLYITYKTFPKKYPGWVRFVLAGIILVFSVVLFFGYTNLLSLFSASQTPPTGMEIGARLLRIFFGVGDFLDTVMMFSFLVPPASVPWLIAGLMSWILSTLWFLRTSLKNPAILTLLGGLLFLLFFPGNQYSYRLMVYVPFVLVLLALGFRTANKKGPWLWRIATILTIGAYVSGNIVAILIRSSASSTSPVQSAREIAWYIARDRSKRNISPTDYVIDAIVPRDNFHYAIFPVLYFLWDIEGYRMPITPEGNDVDRSLLVRPNSPYVYLLCQQFPTWTGAVDSCIQYYRKENPDYVLERSFVAGDRMYLFTFRNNRTAGTGKLQRLP